MTTNHIPLLTVHLFVSRKNSDNGFEEMLQSLEKCGITVKLYNPDDALEEINPKSPRVYISLGPEWSEFTTLNSLPLYERKRWLHYTNPAEIQSYKFILLLANLYGSSAPK